MSINYVSVFYVFAALAGVTKHKVKPCIQAGTPGCMCLSFPRTLFMGFLVLWLLSPPVTIGHRNQGPLFFAFVLRKITPAIDADYDCLGAPIEDYLFCASYISSKRTEAMKLLSRLVCVDCLWLNTS